MSRPIANTAFTASFDWPADCGIQGGSSGLVLLRGTADSYITPFFFEASPTAPATFIRGEGASMAQAEESAWRQWQQRLQCPLMAATGEHHFEPRGYTNGAGFCTGCNLFASHVFTGEQLGQFCRVCAVGTTYGTDCAQQWRCEQHMVYTRIQQQMYASTDRAWKRAPKAYPLDLDEPDTVGECLFCQVTVQDSATNPRTVEQDPQALGTSNCPESFILHQGRAVPGVHVLVAVEVDPEVVLEDPDLRVCSLSSAPNLRMSQFIAVDEPQEEHRMRSLGRVVALQPEQNLVQIKVYPETSLYR